MYERKINQFNQYFNERIEACKAQGEALKTDARFDEAVFEKVKENVFDIFKTVFGVAVNSANGDMVKLQQFFTEKSAQIPQNWQESLEKAKAHDDTKKMHMESIKLEVLDEIKETFERIWREEA